jgi:hypothetical protein
MNVHAVCNVGSLCNGWATACCTSIQCCGLDDHPSVSGREEFSFVFSLNIFSRYFILLQWIWINRSLIWEFMVKIGDMKQLGFHWTDFHEI